MPVDGAIDYRRPLVSGTLSAALSNAQVLRIWQDDGHGNVSYLGDATVKGTTWESVSYTHLDVYKRQGYLGASLQQLSYASLIVVGALTVMRGEMTTGGLIACSILSGRILNPILAVPGLMIQRAHARAAEDGLEKLYQLKTDNHGVRRPLVPRCV